MRKRKLMLSDIHPDNISPLAYIRKENMFPLRFYQGFWRLRPGVCCVSQQVQLRDIQMR